MRMCVQQMSILRQTLNRRGEFLALSTVWPTVSALEIKQCFYLWSVQRFSPKWRGQQSAVETTATGQFASSVRCLCHIIDLVKISKNIEKQNYQTPISVLAMNRKKVLIHRNVVDKIATVDFFQLNE